MAQRSELFAIKNIAIFGLLLIVFYGTYSYNELKGRLNVSNANFISVRSEIAQGSNQLKAALKGRMSCMKDLKQMRTTMWELRSKMSDLETESSKQKHETETKVTELKKEADSCKTQYETLQKDFMKLKEDDKVKLVKDREDEEENAKKLRKLNTEHDLAVSKLNDQVQDLKTENEKLKVALAAAKIKINKYDGAPVVSDSHPKRAPVDEPARQVQPPGLSRRHEKIADLSTTAAARETNASNTSVTSEVANPAKLKSTTDTAMGSTRNKSTTAKMDGTSTSQAKTRTNVTTILQNQVKDSDLDVKTKYKSKVNQAMLDKKKLEDLEDNQKPSQFDRPPSAVIENPKEKVDESKLSGTKTKSLKFESQPLDKENKPAVLPPPNEKLEENKADEKKLDEKKPEESMESNKVLQAPHLQAALNKMKRARASAVKEEPQQQQVDLPPHAVGPKIEKIDQLPQPINQRNAGKGRLGSDTEEMNDGTQVEY